MKRQGTLLERTKDVFFNVQEIGVIVPLVACCLFFGLKSPVFYSIDNLINILRNTALVLIAGVGMTILLITGNFDLAVGEQIAFTGVCTALLLQTGLPVWLCIILGLLLNMIVGAITGGLCVYMKIPCFITGIGMQYVIKGTVLVIRGGSPVYPLPDGFNIIGSAEFIGIPVIVWIALVVAVLGHFVLKYTVYGRQIYAVGGNQETSRLAGIRCKLITFSAFVVCGLTTGLCSLLTAARLESGQPSAGSTYSLMTVAGCIIGGTSLFGGAGTILGTFLGCLLMSVLTNGMTIVRISSYWQQLVLGIIIIASVAFDQYRIARKGR